MEKRIVFMGTPDFAVPVIERIVADGYNIVLVVTQPDRPKGRKQVLTPPPVKVFAETAGIPVFQPEKVRLEYEKILEYKPDLIITAAYGQILPKELLDAPTYGCINVHASLLPELRGGAPIHYAILQGKEKTGVSIMYMVEALDAGDVLDQVTVPILEDDHVGTLHDKLSEAGATLLSEIMPNLFSSKIIATPQDNQKATYAYNIKREQEEIDWEKSHVEIYNHIRGLHPWPVASTKLHGNNIKVWWGEKVNQTYQKEAGEIVKLEPDGFIVACGDGYGIKITELQPAGKKRMDSSSYLRGAGSQLQVGDKLGV